MGLHGEGSMTGWALVIDVSLCGPSSLLMSTFAPTLVAGLGPETGLPACCRSLWYFAHQVGTTYEAEEAPSVLPESTNAARSAPATSKTPTRLRRCK